MNEVMWVLVVIQAISIIKIANTGLRYIRINRLQRDAFYKLRELVNEKVMMTDDYGKVGDQAISAHIERNWQSFYEIVAEFRDIK